MKFQSFFYWKSTLWQVLSCEFYKIWEFYLQNKNEQLLPSLCSFMIYDLLQTPVKLSNLPFITYQNSESWNRYNSRHCVIDTAISLIEKKKKKKVLSFRSRRCKRKTTWKRLRKSFVSIQSSCESLQNELQYQVFSNI